MREATSCFQSGYRGRLCSSVGGTTTRELLLLDFFLSILDLPPSLCQADRRVQSAGWGLHSGLMGDVCGPALKSSPSRPLEPLPVIL